MSKLSSKSRMFPLEEFYSHVIGLLHQREVKQDLCWLQLRRRLRPTTPADILKARKARRTRSTYADDQRRWGYSTCRFRECGASTSRCSLALRPQQLSISKAPEVTVCLHVQSPLSNVGGSDTEHNLRAELVAPSLVCNNR
jgi:hypothetical protein